MRPIASLLLVPNIKRTLFILSLFIGISSFAQEKIAVQTMLDTSFSLPDDPDEALASNSVDFSGRVIMQGNQQENGYMIVFPELSYKSTEGNLTRWSVNVGYVYNTFIPKSEIGFSLSYGWVNHYAKTSRSIGFSSHYAFKLSQRFKLITILDMIERNDLDHLYPENDNQRFIPSVRYGLEICLL